MLSRIRPVFVVFLCLCCEAAQAHIGAHDGSSDWSWDPWVALPLLLACSLYIAGCWRMWRARNLGKIAPPARMTAFAIGMLTLVAALLSPLDALAEQLFSAHMTQHLLLMIVAPPLLVWGRPLMVWLWALPLCRRRRLTRWWNGAGSLQAIYHFLMRPLPAWLLASFALWFWHIPALYNWALANEFAHTLEHLSFFLTSLAFWTLVMQPYGAGRSNPGLALVATVTFALHSGLLGALLTFASVPLYITHNNGFPALSPLQDQQLAGLIMWIPASLVYLAAISWLFVGWLQQAGKISKPIRRQLHDPQLAA